MTALSKKGKNARQGDGDQRAFGNDDGDGSENVEKGIGAVYEAKQQCTWKVVFILIKTIVFLFVCLFSADLVAFAFSIT